MPWSNFEVSSWSSQPVSHSWNFELKRGKVEKILKGSLDSIPSPSPSVKIQIMGGKVCLRCKGKTLLGNVKKLFVFKSLLTTPSNVLPSYLKQNFLPIIWIFTEGDGIKSRLPFKIFFTLHNGDRKLTKSIDDYGNQLILQLFQKSTSTPYQ